MLPPQRLSSALAGLFTVYRVYQTMRHGTGHLRPEDVAESCEPYVVQLSGPNPHVRKVHMVLVTLLELSGPVPRLMAREPHLQKVILRIREILQIFHKGVKYSPEGVKYSTKV